MSHADPVKSFSGHVGGPNGLSTATHRDTELIKLSFNANLVHRFSLSMGWIVLSKLSIMLLLSWSIRQNELEAKSTMLCVGRSADSSNWTRNDSLSFVTWLVSQSLVAGSGDWVALQVT